MRGVNIAKQVAWRLSGRARRAGLVLMYHRVTDLRPDPWSLATSPRHFAEHLEVLHRAYEVRSTSQLQAASRDGSLEGKTVVLTFDDGYHDNLAVAKPLLERWELPATFFVPTAILGSCREFWWDELERLLLEPGVLPPALASTTLARSWQLSGSVEHAPAAAERHHRWRSGQAPPTRRHQIYEELWRLLFEQREATREAALAELFAAAGVDRQARRSYRTLTVDELLSLDHRDGVEIGAHGVSHTPLSNLPVAAQRREIEGSKAGLEDVLGHHVAPFSYPNGSWTPPTARLVAGAGYSCAFTTVFGLTTADDDRFEVPRVVPPDVDGDAFAKWLGRLLPSNRGRRFVSAP